MKTYKTIRTNEFGKTITDSKVYETKEQAINASNSWLRDCKIHLNFRKLRSVDIIENE